MLLWRRIFENIKLISILKQIQGIQQCKLFSLPILPIFLDFPFFQIFPDFIFLPDFLFAIFFPSHQSRPGQTSRLSLSQEFTSLFNLRHSETDLKSKFLSFHFLIYFHSIVHKVIQKIILVLKNTVIAKKYEKSTFFLQKYLLIIILLLLDVIAPTLVNESVTESEWVIVSDYGDSCGIY